MELNERKIRFNLNASPPSRNQTDIWGRSVEVLDSVSIGGGDVTVQRTTMHHLVSSAKSDRPPVWP